jgi:hypothetical protein
VSEAILDDNFSNVFPIPEKSPIKSLVATLLRMAA